METTNLYSPKTLTEVYTVLKTLDLLSKIPKEIVEYLKQNKDNSYKFYFFEEYPLELQIENKETDEFLSYIYLKYICDSEEEKQLIRKMYVSNDLKEETERREKYNPDNIFKSEQSQIEKEVEKIEKELVPQKETFLSKIINKIKSILSK